MALYARDQTLECAGALGTWGAGACPVSPLHYGPAGLPLNAIEKEREKENTHHSNSRAVSVPCHMTTFVFGNYNSLPVLRD